jgi:hypothetical protein
VKMRWIRFDNLSNDSSAASSLSKSNHDHPTNKHVSPGKRTGHCAVCIRGSMYIFGGETGTHCANDMYRFDIVNKVWERVIYNNSTESTAPGNAAGGVLAVVPAPRCGHAAVPYGNTIIMFGGADRLYVVFLPFSANSCLLVTAQVALMICGYLIALRINGLALR